MSAEPDASPQDDTVRGSPIAKVPASARALADQAADRLKQFETIMDRYYRGDPLAKAQQSLNTLIDKHNQWVETSSARHEAESKKVHEEFEVLRELEKQIEEFDRLLAQQPDARERAAVESYNKKVEQRNSLVQQYNGLGKQFKQHQETHNDAVTRSQNEMKQRREQLDELTTAVQQQREAYKRWIETGADQAYFKELNQLYAQLNKEGRSPPTPELEKPIERLRAMRRELGELAIKRHQQAANGLVVVEATLCGREKCFLIVDTGASTVTISAAMVEALGLSDRLGKKVEVNLAGGIKTSGREMVIPQLAVLGMEAKNVDAIVLNEPEVGIDGLLGLSYLKYFDFRIDPSQPDRLILKRKSQD